MPSFISIVNKFAYSFFLKIISNWVLTCVQTPQRNARAQGIRQLHEPVIAGAQVNERREARDVGEKQQLVVTDVQKPQARALGDVRRKEPEMVSGHVEARQRSREFHERRRVQQPAPP